MGLYSTNNELGGTRQALTDSAYKTLVACTAETGQLRRGAFVDIMVGASSAPNATDCGIFYDVSRITAVGTATTVTPVALNPADAASDAICDVNYTIEGTITAASTLLSLSLNQRASQRWVAAPGEELIWPATDENGLALRAKVSTTSAYVGGANATVIHNDL
jgi:hypothetical protein